MKKQEMPKWVQNCKTHHACPCIEWQLAQMEQALEAIHIWATYQEGASIHYQLVLQITAKALGLEGLRQINKDERRKHEDHH